MQALLSAIAHHQATAHLNGFGQMDGFDAGAVRQVGHGTRHAQNAMHGARTPAQLDDSGLQKMRSLCGQARNFFQNLPQDFVDGVLIGAWPQVMNMIREMRSKYNIPFKN